MSEKDSSTTSSTVNPRRRYYIAAMIIGPAFFLIGGMLLMQLSATTNTIDFINELISDDAVNKEDIAEIIKNFEDINKSNLTVFNILLPVFAAWVGAVVAFYFGSENLQKAHEALEKAISPEQKLSKMTVGELMKNQPKTKDVNKVKMDDDIKAVKEKMLKITNVLVVDINNEPLGIIYKWELKDAWNSGKLTDNIKNMEKDFIMDKEWTEKGIKNYASLSVKDTLLDAKKRMDAIAQSIDRRLSVRGVVVEEEKVIGIINFANISAELL